MFLFAPKESTLRKEREARQDEACKRLMAELRALPQFVESNKGLIHALSGCVVSYAESSVQLAWVESYAGADGRVVRLSSVVQQEKYLKLMKAQAASIDAGGAFIA